MSATVGLYFHIVVLENGGNEGTWTITANA
jgi:hypothetical protein